VTTLAFKQVDVFTRAPFRGNPVAVVLGADALGGEAMQRIAQWTNLSETTFVLEPSVPEADYRLRIFTPRAELPFAGHPTIGSAHAVLEAGRVAPKDGRFRQECGAGVLDLSREGGVIWVKAPPHRIEALDAARAADYARTLGGAIDGAPSVVRVGPVWAVADLGEAGRVDALRPDLGAIGRFTEAIGATGIVVFGAASGEAAIHVRAFAPAHGVPEDPVCGSGNVSVAAYLAKTGGLKRTGERYMARQGMALGRDGRVSIRVEGGAIHLGGEAVTCVEGTLRPE
jgi:PhzF family phenazine biosynthesis protein